MREATPGVETKVAAAPEKQCEYTRERQQYWDEFAQSLNRWQRLRAYYQRRLSEICRFIIPPGMRVLELGCGQGDLLASLRPALGVGIDLSAAMVDRGKARTHHAFHGLFASKTPVTPMCDGAAYLSSVVPAGPHLVRIDSMAGRSCRIRHCRRKAGSVLKSLLTHPLTRGIDIDRLETTILRASIIRGKPFLRRIYEEWHTMLRAELPPSSEGAALELGSGADFMKQSIPDAITSECFHIPLVDTVLDGRHLPIRSATLRAILMTNVLHHIPHPRLLMQEAARCVRPGGVLAMIGPWATPWSSLIYRYFHNEPFDPRAEDWELRQGGPLTGANEALPWIIFKRDRGRFDRRFPEWQVKQLTPIMPFRYLLSGGVSLRALMWNCTFPCWRSLETLLDPLHAISLP